jgi:hypothetical protein
MPGEFRLADQKYGAKYICANRGVNIYQLPYTDDFINTVKLPNIIFTASRLYMYMNADEKGMRQEIKNQFFIC